MAIASARAAARAGGMPATAEAVTSSAITLAELTEVLPEGALIAVVEGAAERLGVMALCPSMIASLIEMQAMGRISSRPATARRATRTDAAIAAEFVNALLEEVGNALATTPLGAALAGFRYASYLDDPRPLGLMLEDGGFHALSVTLRLGAGAERTGRVFVAVPGVAAPVTAPAPIARSPAPAADAGAGTADASPRPTLARAVAEAPVALSAILCRRSITLRELRALRPGTVLSLPRGALEAVQIETLSGQPLGTGRLGEADGVYAVRMIDPSGAGVDLPPVSAGDDAVDDSPFAAAPAFDSAAFAPPALDPQTFVDAADEVSPGASFDGPVGATIFAASFEPPIADIGAPDGFRPAPDQAFDMSFAAPVNIPDRSPGASEPLPMSFIIS